MWIITTICAVILQSFRNYLQRILRKDIEATLITWSRFIFSLPLIIIINIILYYNFPSYNIYYSHKFFLFIFLASLTQIIGTFLLVEILSKKNFTVGITYMKTEVVQTAILAFIFLNEYLNILSIIGILITIIAIFILSHNKSKEYNDNNNLISIAYGIGSGFSFSICAILLKKSILEIENNSLFFSSIMVVTYVNIMQNIMLFLYHLSRSDIVDSIKIIIKYYRLTIIVSILSLSASIFWFFSFAIGKVAYVKIVGQIEIIIAFFISHYLLKEKIKINEIIAIILVIIAIILVTI